MEGVDLLNDIGDSLPNRNVAVKFMADLKHRFQQKEYQKELVRKRKEWRLLKLAMDHGGREMVELLSKNFPEDMIKTLLEIYQVNFGIAGVGLKDQSPERSNCVIHEEVPVNRFNEMSKERAGRILYQVLPILEKYPRIPLKGRDLIHFLKGLSLLSADEQAMFMDELAFWDGQANTWNLFLKMAAKNLVAKNPKLEPSVDKMEKWWSRSQWNLQESQKP